jgi:hypothetical protein
MKKGSFLNKQFLEKTWTLILYKPNKNKEDMPDMVTLHRNYKF